MAGTKFCQNFCGSEIDPMQKRVRFIDDDAHEARRREDEAPCEMVPLCLLEAAESHSRGLQAKLERLHDEICRAHECIDELQRRLEVSQDVPACAQAQGTCACCEDPAARTLECCGAGLCAACYDDLNCGTLTCPTCFAVHVVTPRDSPALCAEVAPPPDSLTLGDKAPPDSSAVEREALQPAPDLSAVRGKVLPPARPDSLTLRGNVLPPTPLESGPVPDSSTVRDKAFAPPDSSGVDRKVLQPAPDLSAVRGKVLPPARPDSLTLRGKVLPPVHPETGAARSNVLPPVPPDSSAVRGKLLPPVHPDSSACVVRTASFRRISRVSVW